MDIQANSGFASKSVANHSESNQSLRAYQSTISPSIATSLSTPQPSAHIPFNTSSSGSTTPLKSSESNSSVSQANAQLAVAKSTSTANFASTDSSAATSISSSPSSPSLANSTSIASQVGFSLKTGPTSINNLLPSQVNLADPDSYKKAEQIGVSGSVNELGKTAYDDSSSETQTSSTVLANEGANRDETSFDADEKSSEEKQGQAQTQIDEEQAREEEKAAKESQAKQEQIDKKQDQIEAAEQKVITELAKRDAEVKTHEQAHKAVGGSYAQSPSYSYEKGPDGKRYAVDGEVKIDVSVIDGDPQATFNKMRQVYAAAMAPVEPSPADLKVAAEATQKMNQAKAEMAKERQEAIIEMEDVEQINELANIYKDAVKPDPDLKPNLFEQYQKTEASDNQSTPLSRFNQTQGEQRDTENPNMPFATLAYQKVQMLAQ